MFTRQTYIGSVRQGAEHEKALPRWQPGGSRTGMQVYGVVKLMMTHISGVECIPADIHLDAATR